MKRLKELKIFELGKTLIVCGALFYAYQANDRANEQATSAAAQAHAGCLRGQRALPVLVKGLRALKLSQEQFPDMFPPDLRISEGDITYYKSLRPPKC